QRLFETSLKQAEFRALQHQINPHFLFNTLDTINWLASMEMYSDVIDMVTALGELMRAKINPKGSFGTIQEEISLVETYLKIQSYRFSDKLKYQISVDEEAKDMYMMRLMLQPLVENAVIHGVEQQEKPCHLIIRVQLQDEKLCSEIIDNGPGMSEEMIQAIYRGQTEGIGITNIIHRLELLFAKDTLFLIKSIPGQGTTISIETPLLIMNQVFGTPWNPESTE
ncbi:MAG: sensor histidine kinase, partial [Sphaerochaetaceae bacterium]